MQDWPLQRHAATFGVGQVVFMMAVMSCCKPQNACWRSTMSFNAATLAAVCIACVPYCISTLLQCAACKELTVKDLHAGFESNV